MLIFLQFKASDADSGGRVHYELIDEHVENSQNTLSKTTQNLKTATNIEKTKKVHIGASSKASPTDGVFIDKNNASSETNRNSEDKNVIEKINKETNFVVNGTRKVMKRSSKSQLKPMNLFYLLQLDYENIQNNHSGSEVASKKRRQTHDIPNKLFIFNGHKRNATYQNFKSSQRQLNDCRRSNKIIYRLKKLLHLIDIEKRLISTMNKNKICKYLIKTVNFNKLTEQKKNFPQKKTKYKIKTNNENNKLRKSVYKKRKNLSTNSEASYKTGFSVEKKCSASKMDVGNNGKENDDFTKKNNTKFFSGMKNNCFQAYPRRISIFKRASSNVKENGFNTQKINSVDNIISQEKLKNKRTKKEVVNGTKGSLVDSHFDLNPFGGQLTLARHLTSIVR